MNVPRDNREPHAYYGALRAADPVHWDASLGLWTLTRYAEIATALVHSDLSSRRRQPDLSGLEAAPRLVDELHFKDELANGGFAEFAQKLAVRDSFVHEVIIGRFPRHNR